MSHAYETEEERLQAIRETKRRWEERNREARYEYQREWRKRPEVKARRNKRLKETGKGAEMVNRRRALLLGAEGSHTQEEWLDLCGRYDNLCLRCGEDKPLTRDHVIPLSKGGSDNINNIQPLCRNCNAQKQARDFDYRGSTDMCEIRYDEG